MDHRQSEVGISGCNRSKICCHHEVFCPLFQVGNNIWGPKFYQHTGKANSNPWTTTFNDSFITDAFYDPEWTRVVQVRHARPLCVFAAWFSKDTLMSVLFTILYFSHFDFSDVTTSILSYCHLVF